ncbi:MAG: hypothetical protein KGD64_02230 [Candidatus Heimdallarchaeota archaeon]|nr:hypothetical protein [Candidatus Heimdallarchaeota archaeon]
MPYSKETIELLSDSPFKQFVLMELERERLYQSFIEIDELDEISRIWLSFSKICAQSLSDVSSIANLLYDRYIDEWTRDKSQIDTDDKRKESLTSKIEDLQEFQMESAILMIIYADIVNKGIFGTPPSNDYCTSFIEGYRILNSISQTYFDSAHPRASSIEEVMLTILLLNQKQQVLHLLEESQYFKEKTTTAQERASYELAQAEFGVSFTAQFFHKLRNDWWWKDSIALYSVYERSLYHLQNAFDIYKKLPEDPELIAKQIEQNLMLTNLAMRNKELIEHYLRLSFEAAKNDNFIASFEYLNLVLGLGNEALEAISANIYQESSNLALKESIIKKESFHTFLHGISMLAAKSSQLNYLINTAKKEDLQLIIKEIEDIVNSPDLNINQNYVSSLPFVYLNYVQEFKIAILENIPYEEAMKRAEQNFTRFFERLEFATSDLASQLIELETKGTKVKQETVLHMLENIQNIKLATYFLPKSEGKLYIVKDIECLEFIANSIQLELFLKDKETNEVLDLIYHAKAHYYSTKALEITQLSNFTRINREWVEKRYSRTFIQGQDIELRLFELARQYLFLNTVIDEIAHGYKIANTDDKTVAENYQTIINHAFNQFAVFDAINNRITDDCTELLKHKAIFATESSDINWKAIEVKKQLADALIDFLEATKNAILGYGANNNNDTYKAATYFNDASKYAKKSNETLQPISHYDETFAQIAKTAYEYSILLMELERKSRASEKLQNLPMDQVFNTLKQLTFLS